MWELRLRNTRHDVLNTHPALNPEPCSFRAEGAQPTRSISLSSRCLTRPMVSGMARRPWVPPDPPDAPKTRGKFLARLWPGDFAKTAGGSGVLAFAVPSRASQSVRN
jgi:hypothetical protein